MPLAIAPLAPSSVSRRKKKVSPRTLAPKLYQSHALEVAYEYEQAIEANSLEKIKILLAKLV